MTTRWALLVGAVLLAAVAGLFVGVAGVSLDEVWDGLTRQGSTLTNGVIWNIRVPRISAGLIAGAALGLSGVGLQGVLRNRLAEPFLLGFSPGAGVGVAVGALVSAAAWPVSEAVAAVAASLVVASILVRIARSATSDNGFLLGGVAVALTALALILLVIFAANSPRLPTFTYFIFGGLSVASWESIALAMIIASLGVVAISTQSRSLDLLTLGDVEAKTLGVDVNRAKRLVITGSALAAAASVLVAGVVGFVGLVAPLLGLRLFGPDHRRLAPAAALIGALIVSSSDLLIRASGTVVEIPLGVITSVVGGPILLAAILKGRVT